MSNGSWLEELELEFKEYITNEALEIIGGICIVDKDYRMIYINDEYANSMNISKTQSLGKKIYDVIEDTCILSVLETGISDICALYTRNGNNFIVNRFPIIKDDKIIGVIGQSTFADIYQDESLRKKILDIQSELNYYKTKAKSFTTSKYNIDNIITNDWKMMELKKLVTRIAKTPSTVLITGESGTGKELFAHAIHSLSPRSHKPFIRLNCAAIPENLLESELFGYEKGSFTGALREGKVGEFEMANGGTLMLDEIDSLPINLQSKLLRVIQEKEIKKIGSSKTINIDVRLIFTTNKDLFELVSNGKFREDLYYRINVVNLRIPPLRERMSDIEPLVNIFIEDFNRELGMNITGISKEAMEILKKHTWPGNIRELENSIERAFNYAMVGELQIEHFDSIGLRIDKYNSMNNTKDLSLRDIRELAEKDAIIKALKREGGNKTKVANVLKIDRSVLYDKIKKYNIDNQNNED